MFLCLLGNIVSVSQYITSSFTVNEYRGDNMNPKDACATRDITILIPIRIVEGIALSTNFCKNQKEVCGVLSHACLKREYKYK